MAPGCGGTPLAIGRGVEGSEAVVEGDWDDLEAAVTVGAEEAEMALTKAEVGDRLAAFAVRTIGGEAGELRAESSGSGTGAMEAIRLTARVGLFGNPKAEERLLRGIAGRLRALAGREWAPR
jgi:hypothetical protein